MNIPDGLSKQCLDDAIRKVMEDNPSLEFEPEEESEIFNEAFQQIFKIALIELGNNNDEVEEYIANLRVNIFEDAACES